MWRFAGGGALVLFSGTWHWCPMHFQGEATTQERWMIRPTYIANECIMTMCPPPAPPSRLFILKPCPRLVTTPERWMIRPTHPCLENMMERMVFVAHWIQCCLAQCLVIEQLANQCVFLVRWLVHVGVDQAHPTVPPKYIPFLIYFFW